MNSEDARTVLNAGANVPLLARLAAHWEREHAPAECGLASEGGTHAQD
jgi:hypothetical protein